MSAGGADIHLRTDGLASFMSDLHAGACSTGGVMTRKRTASTASLKSNAKTLDRVSTDGRPGSLGPAAPSTITVHIPLAVRRRGGRKLILRPDGAPALAIPQTRVDNTLVKALARAHRWKQMIESGEFASVTELAAVEKINHSYLSRVLRLTLLAPNIVEAILDGRHPVEIDLAQLIKPMPIVWEEQRRTLEM